MKIIFSLSGLVIIATMLFVVFVIEIEKAQFRHNAQMVSYAPSTSVTSNVLVIYFSRSNNTEVMAMEIARHYNAQLIRLKADKYKIGFFGWLNAISDAQTKHAVIVPKKMDLSSYDTIFIGSPIWWYSPAPPVWQFVSNNDLTNKNIILFNTFNSQFKQEYIDDFKAEIESKGGGFVKHIYVKRERMGNQISTKDLLEKVRQQIL